MYYVIHISKGNSERKRNIVCMSKKIGQHINIFEGTVGGVSGCYHSHVNLISKLQNREGYSVVLEDDFLPPANFHSKIKKVIERLGDTPFDMVYLGNLDGNHGIHYKDDIYRVDKKRLLTGTHAYIINNRSCKKISILLKKRMKHPVDIEFHNLMKEDLIKGYVLWPSIVFQQPRKLKSTISSI